MQDEKPLDLRDRLAIEVLNGVISNRKSDDVIKDILHFITYNDSDVATRERVEENATKRIEKVIRNCYKVADIMRKIRLESFT